MPIVLPTRMPFAPGKSPFHVKGSVYQGVRRRTEMEYAGGLDALVKTLGDPELESFCKQKFLPSGWYDYLPLLLIARAATIALMHNSADKRAFDEVMRDSANQHAQADLGGIYKLLLRFTSPEVAMRRTPAVHKQYYDFGTCTVDISQKGRAETWIYGWPELALSFFPVYNRAFVDRLIILAGGENPRAEWDAPIPDGATAGVPLVKVRVMTTWD